MKEAGKAKNLAFDTLGSPIENALSPCGTPVHVDSADNLADIFTKILSTEVFERLRDQLLWDPTK